ncbi:MAG: FG-GAP repeat protein [Acidobacteria bacterium]|nr:FG-GAP repeat protein [Acidobacteriota bacterium]
MPSDFFGYSVSISENTAVIGAHGQNVNGNEDQGAAYVFVKTGANWELQQKLTMPIADAQATALFGLSVAVSGDTLIVGSPNQDNGSNTDQGAAYVYVRSGTTWTFQQRLRQSDGAVGDNFGWSVAIDGNTAVVELISTMIVFTQIADQPTLFEDRIHLARGNQNDCE